MDDSSVGKESYVSLATFRRDGREVKTPVWVAEEGGLLFVFSEGTAGKVKRIRATKRVRLAGCDVRGRVHGDWVDGSGRILSEESEIERGYRALRRKYGFQLWLTDFFSRLTGRYGRRAMIGIRLDSEDREGAGDGANA